MSLRVRRCGANPSQRVTLTITSERKGWTLSEYGVGTYPFPAYSSRRMSLWLFSALDNCRLRQPHRYTIGFETLCVETGSDMPAILNLPKDQQGVPAVSGDGCRGINHQGRGRIRPNTERRRVSPPVHLGLRGVNELDQQPPELIWWQRQSVNGRP